MDTKAIATMIDGTQVKGKMTTDHAASSYGQPVFVDRDNQAYDWSQIVSISTASAMGSTITPKKSAAARENGKKGGRPRKTE